MRARGKQDCRLEAIVTLYIGCHSDPQPHTLPPPLSTLTTPPTSQSNLNKQNSKQFFGCEIIHFIYVLINSKIPKHQLLSFPHCHLKFFVCGEVRLHSSAETRSCHSSQPRLPPLQSEYPLEDRPVSSVHCWSGNVNVTNYWSGDVTNV